MAVNKKTFKELIAGLTSESSDSIELLVRNTSSGDVKKIKFSDLKAILLHEGDILHKVGAGVENIDNDIIKNINTLKGYFASAGGTLPLNLTDFLYTLNIAAYNNTRIFQLAFPLEKNTAFIRKYRDGNLSEWKEFAFTDSTVSAANKLSTPRTLWGQSFDGSGNVDGVLKITPKMIGNVIDGVVVESDSSMFDVNVRVKNRVQNIALQVAQNGGIWDYTNVKWMIAASLEGNAFTQFEKFGFGTNKPEYNLHVIGNIFASGKSIATAHETSSDIRLKSNIVDKEVSLTDIANAPVIDYTMKIETPVVKEELVDNVDADEQTVVKKVRTASANSTTAESITVDETAQEVEVTEMQCTGSTAQYWKEILPNCVSEGKDGMLSMQYGNIALVSVISLAREVAALKETVKVLKERVEELEKKNI